MRDSMAGGSAHISIRGAFPLRGAGGIALLVVRTGDFGMKFGILEKKNTQIVLKNSVTYSLLEID